MTADLSNETCGKLREVFDNADLLRPMRIERYEVGMELSYDIRGVWPDRPAHVKLVVDKFVGGGFAGQVYRVKVADIDARQGEIPGLRVGELYAIKILIPPSKGSLVFRNAVYGIGFQAPFQLQCNPTAARAGALWQKFIRRSANLRFGSERAVVDILATFVDSQLGSCGEISEWVSGRTWHFEVDDRLDARRKWKPGQNDDKLNSPEYLAKRTFMSDFVKMLHEIGAHEFARQYEWSTCKSQPNALKRLDTEDDPRAGLTAVDFRAGLALLPFLPMAPGDFPLIIKGLARGSLVQFDRGNLKKLRRFIDANPQTFANMAGAFEELKACEEVYRNSQVDITHNHARLLTSGRLWSTILNSAVTGWRVRNIADDSCSRTLGGSKLLTILFALVGLIPLLSLVGAGAFFGIAFGFGMGLLAAAGCSVGILVGGSIVGRLAQRFWGRADYRRHYAKMLASGGYFIRAIRGRIAEQLISWYRDGRISKSKAIAISRRPIGIIPHTPLSILPAGLHRTLTDWKYARSHLWYIFVRPVMLYFNTEAREQWLRDMLAEGRKNHLLSEEDAQTIESRIKEPFIQKYLKSLAVHVCTLPITQVVSVAVALWYVWSHPELPWGEAWGSAGAILLAFQITPISPGSLVRGLYVLYLVIRERNFKDYNIAVFLGFFKYIGYLAFPIQMAYHYPALARFMASHWATGAVHIIPVFGEKGALLEHFVFDMFYNYPLTVRRRMRLWAEARKGLAKRLWHALPCIAVAAGVLALADWLYASQTAQAPTLKALWYVAILTALPVGAALARWAGGGNIATRVKLAIGSGITIGLLSAGMNLAIIYSVFSDPAGAIASATQNATELGESPIIYALLSVAWRAFWFTVLTVTACLGTEITASEPKTAKLSD